MQSNPTPQDGLITTCIQQVNLDALWGHESATVHANTRAIGQLLKQWKILGLPPCLPPLGPHPPVDSFGYAVATGMILKSWDKGHYAAYQQFETIRKLRSGFTNTYMSSLEGATSLHTIGGDPAKHYLSQCPMLGNRNQMDALPTELTQKTQKESRDRANDSVQTVQHVSQ